MSQRQRGRRPVQEITEPQRRTLKEIRLFTNRRGFPPTMKELADILGISHASVHGQVNQLVRKGYLKREARKARGIVILRDPEGDVPDLVAVPIVGRVAAGQPILAEENIVGEVLVEGGIARSGRCFALEVTGDSMVDAGIRERDLVVVREQAVAENGDIVVALLEDEATVKRLFICDEKIELRPENPRHRPIPVGSDAREHLLALLKPHKPYFNGRGLTLPPPSASDGIDYDQLVNVLMNPDTDTPKGLLDALYFVHEMATPEAMDVLIQEAENNGISLDGNPDPTAADVAVQVYLQDKDLLERKHAEQYLLKPRSFEYFQTDAHPIPKFKQPTAKALVALEKDLDDWFEKKKRGRGSKVFVYPKKDSVWFLVRHGDPLRREGSLDGGQASSVFYRPEKYDVLVYEPTIAEIRMHACGKGEKDLFRRQFGRHVFNNEDFFPETGKYTLEPLRTNGDASVVCTDVDGMEWVRLKEIQFFWGGAEKETEIRKANDVFAAYAGRGRAMPQKARIIRVSFQVKFTDSKTARTVTIRPSNIAQYTRDSDAAVVEDWLTKRGFILAEQEDDDE